MRTYLLKIIVVVLLLVSVLKANDDTVDVRALVQQQITAAQLKQNDSSSKAEIKADFSEKIPVPEIKPIQKQEASFFDISFIVKSTIMLVAVIVAAVVVVRRRLKIKRIEDKMNFKKNIKAIREEQLVKEMDPRLKFIRKKLTLNSDYLKKSEREVVLAAKQFRIAKEELLLASRLNSHKINQKLQASVQ